MVTLITNVHVCLSSIQYVWYAVLLSTNNMNVKNSEHSKNVDNKHVKMFYYGLNEQTKHLINCAVGGKRINNVCIQSNFYSFLILLNILL